MEKSYIYNKAKRIQRCKEKWEIIKLVTLQSLFQM